MIKRWLSAFAILFLLALALLLCLAVYRVGQQIVQPHVLFALGNALFVLALTGWTAVAASHILGHGKFEESDAAWAERIEAKALLGVTFLILAAYLLTAQSLFLQQKPGSSFFPWVAGAGPFVQGLSASAVFSILIWLTHIFLKKAVPQRDPWLFPLVCLLSGLGLVLLFRLGPDIAEVRRSPGLLGLSWLQFRSFALSLLILFFSVTYFTGRRLESLTRKRYIYILLSVVLITLTAFFGTELHGKRLAVNLGIMSFQTVELVKILALFFMVGYFRYEMGFLESGKNLLGLPRGRYLGPYVTMWALTLLPIFLQKDLGPTALIFSLFLVMFYLGTGSAFSVWFGLLMMAAIGVASYYAGIPSMVRTRIDMWLEPFSYSQNLAEALWAVGSAGWFGAGSGRGLCHYIPVVHSDFNFAAIAEEWGVTGAVSVLACFGLLVWRTLHLARKARSPYMQLFVAGLGALWVIQTFIIVGGNLGLLPLTGITLPFISFGGSSLVVNFLALGIILRFSSEIRQDPAPQVGGAPLSMIRGNT